MAYIPTIHTFEDDINENRGFDEAPIVENTNTSSRQDSIIVSEKPESSVAKKIISLISILLIIGSLSAIGYYFYNNYKNQKALDLANQQAAAMKAANDAAQSNQNNLSQTLPLLAPGINPYIKTFSQNENLLIITIKPNTDTVDNYSALYAYILAHQNDLGRDLVNAFKLEQIASDSNNNLTINKLDSNSSSTNKNNQNTNASAVADNKTNSSLETMVNFFDPKNLQQKISSSIDSMAPQSLISPENLVWENKTLNNQTFQIANAGVVTLIYGYVKNNNYLIFSTSLKAFFDAINGLQ